MKNIFKL